MRKGLAVVCLTVALTLGACELLVRILRINGAEAIPALVTDEHIGWANAANQHGFVIQRVPEIFKTRYQTNSLGMRDREHATAKNGRRRLLGLGDSITEGYGVEQDETYLKVLESALTGVDVWNLGVVGYSTDQELEQLRQVVDVDKPDVVTVAFYFNDLAENTVRAARWEPHYVKPFFTFAQNGPVLTDADSLRAQKARELHDQARPRARVKQFLNNFALYRLVNYARASYRDSKARARRASRRAAPSDRVPKWSDLDYLYRVQDAPGRDSAFALAEGLLREINRMCAARGIAFVLTYVPAPIDAIPGMMQKQLKIMGESAPDSLFDPAILEKKLAEIARRDSIRFVPMVARFRSAPDPAALFLPKVPKDVHLGREGHRVVAQGLAEYLTHEHLLTRESVVSR